MHDYHAVQALVTQLTGEGGRAAGVPERVTQVRIQASPVFSAEALQQAYEMLTRDTSLHGSRLLVEELPEQHDCPRCGCSWQLTADDVAGHVVLCPSCGSPSPLNAGAGLRLVAVSGG